MDATMQQVAKVMTYFNKLQKKYGHTEQGNVLQQKWDMRDIINAVDSKEELDQLFKFFMEFSTDRSFQYFAYNYHSFYESMQRVKIDRLKRRFLQQETLERAKGAKQE